MSQQSTAPHPIPPRTQLSEREPRNADLTVNKVLAAGAAAATSAVMGSFFGVAGTVVGAAIGAVASTVAASIYQRSLDRTRDRLTARIRSTPRVNPLDADTVVMRVEPDVPRRRRGIVGYLAVAAIAFLVGLLAITGVEWVKGSTLVSGEAGTSVGRVLGSGQQQGDQPPADQQGQHDDGDSSDAPGSGHEHHTSTPTPDPTATSTPDGGLGGLLPSLLPHAPTQSQGEHPTRGQQPTGSH